MKKLILLLACFVITASFAVAQISQGGEPLSFTISEKVSLEDVTFQKMPDVDVEALRAEDAELDKLQNMPWRFGKVHQVSLNPQNSGEWDYLENGTKIWRLGISSPGAISINILFDKYKIPEGAQLFIYSADTKDMIGGFTDFNNQEDLYFATSFVFSDNVIVEYNEPADVEFE
ncbi:MAG: lysyl endopeptidase, partial [Bacteroidales bacterium]